MEHKRPSNYKWKYPELMRTVSASLNAYSMNVRSNARDLDFLAGQSSNTVSCL